MTKQYTPHESYVRHRYVAGQAEIHFTPEWEGAAEFDRFLAHVRREAAREALGRLADESNTAHNSAVAPPAPRSWGEMAGAVEWFRGVHYPEAER